MRTLITMICFIIFSTGVFAVEPINEQQVMLYYHIPLGADRQDNNKHQFGLRVDHTTHDPDDVIQISTLEGRPAALDFRMGYKGVQSLKIHGVDYAAYLIARAAEGEEAPVEVTAEPEATAETATVESETGPSAETEEKPQEEKTIVQNTLDNLPAGVIIGVLLGIGLLAGVGG
jgi:hypothetical protein